MMSMDSEFRALNRTQKQERLAKRFCRKWRTVLSWRANIPGDVIEQMEKDLIQPAMEELDHMVNLAYERQIMWDAMEIALNVLSSTGKPIPPSLGLLATRAMHGESTRPTRPEDRPKLDRDHMIVAAVKTVLGEFPEMAPTQNRATDGSVGACSVVSEVLPQFRIVLAPESVEKIWEKQRRIEKGNASEK